MTKPHHALRTKAVARVTIPTGADLHIHTTHSDGECSPCSVVNAAFQAGLRSLAITDHDTVTALEVAQPEADRLGIELISGIEWTAKINEKEIHLLGLFIDPRNPDVKKLTLRMQVARADRTVDMAIRLGKLGLSVDVKALREIFPKATLGRRHLADWLVRTGQVKSRPEAFALYLGDGGPATVSKPRLNYREAIAATRDAGGVAALAHPPYNFRRATLNTLVDAGLGAIEITRSGSSATAKRWHSWAAELNLIPIQGSDFHASPERQIGLPRTPDLELERLRARSQILFDHRAKRAGPAGVLDITEDE
jgi:3',5'-nucleoside bisphosphate phosphatase